MDQFRGRHPRQNFDGQGRANSAYVDQFFEQPLLILREKAVERQGVFTDVSVDAQPHLGARIGQMRERRNRDGHVVPYAAGFHDNLVRVLL